MLAVLSLAGAGPARAQAAAPATTTLDAAAAQRIIAGCVDHSRAKSQGHAIAVVDPGGHQVAFLRMEGSGPGIGAFALEKAVAVAYWRFPTAGMEEAARGTPGFANAPKVVTVAGGVPIFSGDGRSFLGAIGVSGAPPADDAACAEAGVRAAGFRVARGG